MSGGRSSWVAIAAIGVLVPIGSPMGAHTMLTNGIAIGWVNELETSYQRFSFERAAAAPMGSARRGMSTRRSAERYACGVSP